MATTRMVPNSSSSSGGYDGQEKHGSVVSSGSSTKDYELYDYPTNVTPNYRSIPMWLEWIIMTSSCSFFTFLFHHITKTSGTIFIPGKNKKKIAFSILQVLLSWLTCRTIVQDLFYSPSRISQPWMNLRPCSLSHSSTIGTTVTLPLSPSSQTLLNKKEPSTSNNNNNDNNDNDIEIEPLGVHYIKYDNKKQNHYIKHDNNENIKSDNNDSRIKQNRNSFSFDALHCNHGFGASSLSWLPALPSLTRVAQAPFGIAHDCVGFGLTERPLKASSLFPYTSTATAAIGKELLSEQQQQQQPPNCLRYLVR